MKLTLDTPLDMHLHLREGAMLKAVAPWSSAQFAGAVVMPNLLEPIISEAQLDKYSQSIVAACGKQKFTPLMTLFFKNYEKRDLVKMRNKFLGIKLYPAGITTQSENGVQDFKKIEPTLAAMEELEIPLMVHAESNGFVMDREREFLTVCREIVTSFPNLHLVLEHITCKESIDFLNRYDTVSATVTLHHLLITLDDVVGGFMEPDLFCKPIAKTPKDREALRDAVFSGHNRIMFGSDSAPHPRHKKECCGCAAGIFSAPVALPMLAQLFDEADCLEKLQGFISDNAKTRYKIDPPKRQVTLTDTPWEVPERCNDLVPFGAGKIISWSVIED